MAQSSYAAHRLRWIYSNLVAVVDEFGQRLLDDEALCVRVRGSAIQAVFVQIQHYDLRILVLVEAVGIGDLLRHVVLVPTGLLDHISQHLVDDLGL